MTKALLRIRFRSLLAMFLQRNTGNKKQGIGMTILFAFLYLYLGAVMCGMSGFLFYTLSEPYHMMDLDWLYFAMAGLMGLGMAVIGSVFTTQNQLYDARDNDLLLSMPIPPSRILLSRMLPLLAMNLLFVAIVMVPAIVVYAVRIELSFSGLILQLLSIPGITLLAQAIACFLGWLLHLLMSRINKSLASVLFVIAFLAIYWGVYYNANDILSSLIYNFDAFANTLSAWVWPIYAMGAGCTGVLWNSLAFLGVCSAVFGAVCWVLSRTFLHTATASHVEKKRQKLVLSETSASPANAILRKELTKFITTPVYLTNMGLGIVLTVALTVAGAVMKPKVMEILSLFPLPQNTTALLVCAILIFLASTMCISTPSVSLEGKNLWILKSMPVSAKTILHAKLNAHILLCVPVTGLSGLILGITYECGLVGSLLCAVVPALMALLNGIAGMSSGLKWARFDYINEVYPCKQSTGVLVTMLGIMGLVYALGLLYAFVLVDYMAPLPFLASIAVLLTVLCYGFYRLMVTWGIRKWNSF